MMRPMTSNLIITGLPRSGKTTLLKRIIAEYNHKIGFVTNELRQDGEHAREQSASDLRLRPTLVRQRCWRRWVCNPSIRCRAMALT